jgi:methylenetetrahydrofolate reductase (NADPH)
MYISDFLGKSRLSVSFEFFPPKTEAGRATLLEAVQRMQSVEPDFVSVTYGAGGSTRTQTFELCQEIRSSVPSLVMAHLTCVCHTRTELGVIADKLWESGVRNIMALRGDRPKDMLHDAPASEGLAYGADLIAFLKARHDFCTGGGCYPEGHTETQDISLGVEHAKLKVDAGCDFLVTQMFFDNDAYFRYVDLLSAAGVSVPVLPGIMPVTGFAQLDKFENKFGAHLPPSLRESILRHEGDEAAIGEIGIEWAAAQCKALIDGGAPGIHFYTLNKSTATMEVCRSLDRHEAYKVARR